MLHCIEGVAYTWGAMYRMDLINSVIEPGVWWG
jgi:hypothetical protein